MSKTAEAFRTIGEVAGELDVPKHVLRFWEGKFPHIRPMKRGGGRRYYRPEDMELLRGIRHLLHAEGYTIKGVQKILREQGVDQVKATAASGMAAAAGGKTKGRGARAQDTQKSQPTAGNPAALDGHGVSAASKRLAAAEAKIAVRTSKEIVADAIRELEICRQLLTAAPSKSVAAPVAPLRATRT
ncbi:MAG: MerR family transcriptional regulator [Hyphomicrobium sp.]|nr:MerR family transcriptional regulator [Hyphomicrobium sp.]